MSRIDKTSIARKKIETKIWFTLFRLPRAATRKLNGTITEIVYYLLTGKRIRITNPVYIDFLDNVVFSSGCIIGPGCKFITEMENATLLVGENVCFVEDVYLDYSGNIEVGDNTYFSRGSKIYTHDHGYNPRSLPIQEKLVIENNVWIGTEAKILSGVKRIGHGSVIGAGSIVTKEVPNNTIVAGVPARAIGRR